MRDGGPFGGGLLFRGPLSNAPPPSSSSVFTRAELPSFRSSSAGEKRWAAPVYDDDDSGCRAPGGGGGGMCGTPGCACCCAGWGTRDFPFCGDPVSSSISSPPCASSSCSDAGEKKEQRGETRREENMVGGGGWRGRVFCSNKSRIPGTCVLLFIKVHSFLSDLEILRSVILRY